MPKNSNWGAPPVRAVASTQKSSAVETLDRLSAKWQPILQPTDLPADGTATVLLGAKTSPVVYRVREFHPHTADSVFRYWTVAPGSVVAAQVSGRWRLEATVPNSLLPFGRAGVAIAAYVVDYVGDVARPTYSETSGKLEPTLLAPGAWQLFPAYDATYGSTPSETAGYCPAHEVATFFTAGGSVDARLLDVNDTVVGEFSLASGEPVRIPASCRLQVRHPGGDVVDRYAVGTWS